MADIVYLQEHRETVSPARGARRPIRVRAEVKPLPELRRARRIEHLARLWDQCEPEWVARGLAWYEDAAAEIGMLAARAGVPRSRALAVAAILSQANTWNLTMRGTGRALGLWVAGKPFDSGVHRFTQAQDRARRVLAGCDPETVMGADRRDPSYKIRRMYARLCGDRGVVVIDRHHWRFLEGLGPEVPAFIPKGRQYLTAEEDTIAFEDAYGLARGSAQPVLWCQHLKHRAYGGEL